MDLGHARGAVAQLVDADEQRDERRVRRGLAADFEDHVGVALPLAPRRTPASIRVTRVADVPGLGARPFSEDVVHLQAVTFLETVGVCTLLECADAARSASTRPTLHSP